MPAPSPGLASSSASASSATSSSGSAGSSAAGSASMADAVVGSSSSTPTPTPTATPTATPSWNSSAVNASSSANATADDDAFTSAYGSESGSSYASLMYRRTEGSCAFYPVDDAGCRAPRSCFDCLNYNVAPERAGCMVSEVGQCVSVTGNYSLAWDFHFAVAANANSSSASSSASMSGSGSGSAVEANVTVLSAAGYQFADANATYCASNDTKCAACRRGVFLDVDPAAITTTSLFCTGADGCVCIALCELDAWASLVGGSRCQNTTTTVVSGVGSSSGNTTAVNSGAGGAGSDDSTQGGVGGVDTNSGDSMKLGTFWNAAFGVLGVLALALVVVIFLSKHHQRNRHRREHMGTPQAPVISPRSGSRPPESLIEFLVRRPQRDQPQFSTGRTTIGGATTRSSRATVDGEEGEDGRLRLSGWKAMRQELIEKEILQPEIGASGIQRVAISHCLPVGCDPDSTDTLSADCLSPRVQRRNPFNDIDEDDAILGSRMQRFTARSLSSSAYMSPPSDAIPFMDEIDEEFDVERGHDSDALDCFDELKTPPARTELASGTKL